MLEMTKHEAAFFVTLTYDKEHVPCDGSVSVRDAQLYLKRLRAKVFPRKVRYYIVGEYGDMTRRPHYHVALFGKLTPEEIKAGWSFGHVHVGTLTPQSSGYLVSYVVKQMTRKDDARLEGRAPEFARMSLKPGLGAGMPVDVIARAGFSKGGSAYVAREWDVPGRLRFERKMWPLGRYLKSKVREAMGMDGGEPAASAERRGREMQSVLREDGAREKREEQRVQVGRRVDVLWQITRSKKGTGL